MKKHQTTGSDQERTKRKPKRKWMRIILYSMLVIILLPIILIGGLIVWYDIENANTPQHIARRAQVSLPEYIVTRSDDNLIRAASAWTYYEFDIKFIEPLTDKDIQRFERQGMIINKDSIYVMDFGNDDWNGTIMIDTESGEGYMFYTFWDMFS